MFVMVEHVWEMTVKKSCKYGGYGSFSSLALIGIYFVCGGGTGVPCAF